jgi:hypothetical protein
MKFLWFGVVRGAAALETGSEREFLAARSQERLTQERKQQ